MSIKTAYSLKEDIRESVSDIKNQLRDIKPKMVIYFASAKYSAEKLSAEMQKAFDKAAVFGNTTAGEIVTGKMLKKSLVAMAFDSSSIEDVKIEVVENIKSDGDKNLKKAFESFEKYYGIKMSDLDYKKFVGVVLIDGLSMSEEKIMDSIGNSTNIFFIGGSAGDDLAFKQTNLYANGKSYANAAILALLKPAKEFDFIKTQSFSSLDKKLTATKADESSRRVFEFNGRSAAEAYAEALGVKCEDASNYFMSNPVGLMVDEVPYVRSP
ncbi:MAG TPA: FIST N-terminal domain-containing protein, partial [bacterium]|nr:FIST N-terminal domain-containing protein [bacterium]